MPEQIAVFEPCGDLGPRRSVAEGRLEGLEALTIFVPSTSVLVVVGGVRRQHRDSRLDVALLQLLHKQVAVVPVGTQRRAERSEDLDLDVGPVALQDDEPDFLATRRGQNDLPVGLCVQLNRSVLYAHRGGPGHDSIVSFAAPPPGVRDVDVARGSGSDGRPEDNGGRHYVNSLQSSFPTSQDCGAGVCLESYSDASRLALSSIVTGTILL